MVLIMWLFKALYQIYKIMHFKMTFSYIFGHTACCYYPFFPNTPVTLWLLQKCGFETGHQLTSLGIRRLSHSHGACTPLLNLMIHTEETFRVSPPALYTAPGDSHSTTFHGTEITTCKHPLNTFRMMWS